MVYRAFDWLMTAAVRHPSRAASAFRWVALVVLGVLLVSAMASGSIGGSIVLGVLTAVAVVVVMRGVYVAAAARHVDGAAN